MENVRRIKMNKFRTYVIPIIVLLLVLNLPLQAVGLKKIAQSGMKWLSIPVGANGAALGNAYVAMVNDASSVFWNPAGLGLSEGKHIFLSQTRWIAEINVNAAAVSWNAETWGVFAAHFISVDWGTFHGTRRANNDQGFVETGTFSPTNYAVGVSYARRVSDAFSFGGTLKYLYEELGSNLEGSLTDPADRKTYKAEKSVMAFDFGTIYYTGFKDLRLAMTLSNFSQELKYRAEHFQLPLTFKFGVAMDVTQFWKEESDQKVTLVIDAVHPRDFTERVHFGLEYNFRDMVFLRGGYKTNYDEEDFSLGAGFQYGLGNFKLGLDYSYVNFQNFDAVHMFSFDFNF